MQNQTNSSARFLILFAIILAVVSFSLAMANDQATGAETDDTVQVEQTEDDDEPVDEGEIGEGLVVDNDEPEPEPIDDVEGDDFDPWVDGDADGVTEYGFEVHEFPEDYDGGIVEDDELEGCAP